MKRIFKVFVFAFVFLIGITSVNAASGFSVSANSTNVIVGNTVKVTVKVSSNDLGAWSYCISYDSSVLKLTSSTADASTCVKAGVVNLTGTTETFTFKALKSGTSTVTVKNAAIYSYKTETQIGGISIGSTKIKCLTQSELEATYSTNAYLSSISVSGTNVNGDIANYDLNPQFDKETKEYTVNVPNDVEKGNISFKKADGTATVSGGGDVDFNEGSNTFELVVTAQKGNQLKYTVLVVREELDPIEVGLDDKIYTIIRRADALPQFYGYSATVVDYNGTDIPALVNDTIDYTIVGVKDSEGNKKMYVYKDGSIKNEYIEYTYGNTTITPLDIIDDDVFDYTVSVNRFVINDNYYIIYGLDTSSNEKNYYLFNKKDGSFILYDGSIEKVSKDKEQIYKYIIYGLLGFSALLLLIVIFGKRRNKPKKEKKVKRKEFEELFEENEDEYVEDLTEVKEIKEEPEVVEQEVIEETPEEIEEEVHEEIQTKELDIDEDTIDVEPMVDKKALKKQKQEEKKKAKEEAKKAKKETKVTKKKKDDFDW